MYGVDLDHAAEEAADQRRNAFDGDDLSRRVIVARGRGALRAIDAADDRRQRQRDRHGKYPTASRHESSNHVHHDSTGIGNTARSASDGRSIPPRPPRPHPSHCIA